MSKVKLNLFRAVKWSNVFSLIYRPRHYDTTFYAWLLKFFHNFLMSLNLNGLFRVIYGFTTSRRRRSIPFRTTPQTTFVIFAALKAWARIKGVIVRFYVQNTRIGANKTHYHLLQRFPVWVAEICCHFVMKLNLVSNISVVLLNHACCENFIIFCSHDF